jgi:hypothetical protein
MHNLPAKDWSREELSNRIGVNIVLETYLVPFIISLLDSGNDARLREIMDWLERLLQSKDFWVANETAVGVFEPLVTSHWRKGVALYSYMGERSRETCRDIVADFNVPAHAKQRFGSG